MEVAAVLAGQAGDAAALAARAGMVGDAAAREDQVSAPGAHGTPK